MRSPFRLWAPAVSCCVMALLLLPMASAALASPVMVDVSPDLIGSPIEGDFELDVLIPISYESR